MTSYVPREQFLPFHHRHQRWACIVAHRRAGKTVACINELLTRALASKKTNAQFAYIAPYFVQAKQIAWEYIKLYGRDVIVRSNESELYVEVTNRAGSKSKIFLFGADNPDRLRGLYLDGCVIDEPADISPSFFALIIRPMLADRKGWCVWVGTPKGHDEFYEIYVKSINNPEWYSLRLKASESGLLNEDELKSIRADMDDDQYEQEMETNFEAAIRGAYYGKIMADLERKGLINDEVLPDPDIPVDTFWDLGVADHMAIWIVQNVGSEVRWLEALSGGGYGIEDYIGMLRERPYNFRKDGEMMVCHGPHDLRVRELTRGKKSRLEVALEMGVRFKIVPNIALVDGRQALRSILKQSCFNRTLTKHGVLALQQHRGEYDEDRKVLSALPIKDWTGHYADAARYVAVHWKELVADTPPPYKPKEMLFHKTPSGTVKSTMSIRAYVEGKERQRASED